METAATVLLWMAVGIIGIGVLVGVLAFCAFLWDEFCRL